MKKIILILALLIIASKYSNAQTAWAVTGNTGITTSNFIGTTNNTSLRFRTNNAQQMILDTLGRVGIGTTKPVDVLSVIATTTANQEIGLFQNTNTSSGTIIDLDRSQSNRPNLMTFSTGNKTSYDWYVGEAYNSGGAVYSYTIGTGISLTNALFTILNTGKVGIGTTSPSYNLDVTGTLRSTGQISSTLASGTAPFVITSTTVNTNLNADLLDGYHASSFQMALTNPVTGTLTSGYLPKATGSTTIGNSPIYTDGTNIGIGTTSPSEQLSITGNFSLPATTATTGIIKSGSNTLLHTYGTGNFFAGISAGNLTLTGTYNVGLGTQSLLGITSGTDDIGMGYQSLYSITKGSHNIGIGSQSLYTATGSFPGQTGNYNIGIGYQALYASDGSSNIGIGPGALFSATSAIGNISIGVDAGYSLTTGNYNTFIGINAGYSGSQKVDATNSMALGNYAYTTADSQFVYGSSSVKYHIFQSGKVGIGTTTPTKTLDVNGTLNVRSMPIGTSVDSLMMYENGQVKTIAASNLGIVGPTGATGPTGSAGVQGNTGITGATGTAGTTGAIGVTGPTGVQGNTGLTGATGIAGVTGAQGNTGLTGATGATGTAGTNGSNGATGATGPTGSVGATGATGLGYAGLTSASSILIGTGSKVFTTNLASTATAFAVGNRVRIAYSTTPSDYMEGLVTAFGGLSLTVNVDYVGGSGTFTSWKISTAGAVGSTGATGVTGTAGTNGSNGATGATGPTGIAGVTGAQGIQGVTGLTGAQGIAGATGATGTFNGTAVDSLNVTYKLHVNGTVGIGTSTPQQKLHIKDDAATFVKIQSTSASNAGIITTNSSQEWALGTNSASYFGIKDNTNNKMMMMIQPNTGYMGIGTITPQQRLHLSSDTAAFVKIQSTSASNAGIITTNSSQEWMLGTNSASYFGINDNTNNKMMMMIQPNTGYVGIGTTSPVEKLTVVGNVNVSGRITALRLTSPDSVVYIGDSSLLFIHWRNELSSSPITTGGIRYKGMSLGWSSYGIGAKSIAIGNNVQASDNLGYYSIVLGSGIDLAHPLVNNVPHSLMVGFDSNIPTFFVGPPANGGGQGQTGNVGIGTSTPDATLAVNGTIHSKNEITVDNNGTWNDWVFENNYKPMPVFELEKYVSQNKHLPGIPSAEEVNKNGIKLAEMNKQLLKQVEELTLYLIEQSKQIQILQKEVEGLKNK